MRRLRFLLIGALLCGASLVAAPSIKVTPATLTFTYQEGSAALPAAQTLAISAASGAASTTVVVNTGGSQWITCSPNLGKTALAVKVSVNPTSLPIGQYSETLVLTTPETTGEPITVPVTLVIRAAPADIRVTPTTVNVAYRLGDAPPQAVNVGLTTTGGLLSYSASATGTKWLRVAPAGGAIFPGFRTNIGITVDTADLVPGAQKGTLTIATPDAVTKTTTVSVNLSVQPGQPVANSLWPPRINVGASDSTVTITGERYYSGTTVKTGTTVLKSTVLGPNALNVVIPASLMATPGTIPLVVANPDPGGGAAGPIQFEVLPPGPLLLSVVNAASQLPSSLAPSTVFTIYGSGLGPDTLASFDGSTPYLPTTLGNTRVYINGVAVPLIYTSARQVSAVAPNSLVADRAHMIEVEYGPLRSLPFPILSVAAGPALFTTSGTGTGNAAAFQVDAVTGAYSLNSDKTPASKGSVLVLYATGIAPLPPVPPDGFVAIGPSNSNLQNLSVLLGDSPADLLYAGYAPGLVVGIVQINVRVPETTPTGKAVPILLKVGNATSQAGVTLNVK